MQACADSELVHDRARDLEFERIYRRYVRDVYRYTLAVLRNPADAEDITQTTFLNAYRAYLRGAEPLRPRHWLIKIAHNACRSRHLRAVRRPQEVPLEETIAAIRVPPDDVPKVEELLTALGKLPFNQRSALVMRELEGRSYAEISELLEVSVASVETLIFRARRTLRRDRSLLGVLGAVPLPPSLTSYVAGGSGAVAGGGTAVGSGVLFKVLLAITAGVVAGTVGTGVEKVLGKNAPPGLTAAGEPEGSAAFTRIVASTPGSSLGLRGPIVLTREGPLLVASGGTFGARPAASLMRGDHLGRAEGQTGTWWENPVSVGDGAAPAATGSAAPAASTSAVGSSLPSSPTISSLTDTVSDATSVPDVPSVPTVSVPTPSVPAAPPPPVSTPSVTVTVPPLPSLPPPPPLPDVP